MGRALLAGVALAATLILPVPVIAAGKTHNIAIEGMKYVPERLEVQAGATVIWSNKDLVPHTVTAAKASIESGSIAPGANWKLTVRRKGQIDYVCRFHPEMHGTLVVR